MPRIRLRKRDIIEEGDYVLTPTGRAAKVLSVDDSGLCRLVYVVEEVNLSYEVLEKVSRKQLEAYGYHKGHFQALENVMAESGASNGGEGNDNPDQLPRDSGAVDEVADLRRKLGDPSLQVLNVRLGFGGEGC